MDKRCQTNFFNSRHIPLVSSSAKVSTGCQICSYSPQSPCSRLTEKRVRLSKLRYQAATRTMTPHRGTRVPGQDLALTACQCQKPHLHRISGSCQRDRAVLNRFNSSRCNHYFSPWTQAFQTTAVVCGPSQGRECFP